MITNLHIKNFKSWKDTGDLQFAPLTGFFGANSSGKTSILQSLLMLKQTAESPDRSRVINTGDSKSLVDLGTFYDIIHSHQIENPLDFTLAWKFPEILKVDNPQKKKQVLFQTSEMIFNTLIRQRNGSISVEEFKYLFDDYQFGMKRKEDESGKYELISQGYKEKRFPGRVWPLPPPVKCYGFPDEVSGYYQNVGFLANFVLQLEDLFGRMAYLGPLREYPHRRYLWGGESPIDVGSKGELAVHALLASRSRGRSLSLGKRKKKQNIEEMIAHWLQMMGMIHGFSLKPIAKNRKDYEVRIERTKGGPSVLITDVGFGVSQILPILVLCYYVPEHSVIILEQPEIHLHPSVQAWLADVFINVVKNRKVQIILESHSEHLLLRLQRRIAEGDISVEDTAMYFCKMDNSASEIEKLDLDLYGNIQNWPPDFFGDELGERTAMVEAALKRESND